MTDVYGMTKKFKEQAERFIRESLRRDRGLNQPKQGRWHKKGGGGGVEIAFLITNATTPGQADVVVLAGSAGAVTPGTTDEGGGTITATVYDISGCYLNEPNVDLTGRTGIAHWMRVLNTNLVYGTPDDIWVITALCCDTYYCVG